MNVKIVHNTNDPRGVFTESHLSKAFNYWHPIAEKRVGNIVYRIAEGLIDWESGKKIYLLYKNTNLIATAYSIDTIKKFVDNEH